MTGLILAPILSLLAVIVPSKQWFAPHQPILLKNEAPHEVRIVLSEFGGSDREPLAPESAIVQSGDSIDLREIFPQALAVPETYIVRATAVDETGRGFIGTPWVVDVRADRREGAPVGPMVIRVSPLQYAIIHTEFGQIEVIFYYNSAPHTVANFLQLAEEGYYDGLTFHRIVPRFVIQGGDPRGDGSGGPGYSIPAEFNDRPHTEGVLSMARQGDPNERSGAMPRPQYANSAGSQFFICLDYDRTKALDNRYTAFGVVVSGMEVVQKIAQAKIANPTTGRPENPPVIRQIEVRNVTPDHNPYDILRRELGELRPPTQTEEEKPAENAAD